MAKKKKDEPTVNIDGQEYKVADLNQNQVQRGTVKRRQNLLYGSADREFG